MSEAFDPYRKWLGIPPEEQPPHYYRLLGLVPFETDPEVITTAVDGRMALLKRFQSGQYAAASQQLLNQIAAAKVCLLNAEKRSAYDAQLRVRLGDEKKPPKAEPAARKPAADTAQPDMPAIKVDVVTAPVATSKARTTGNGKPAAARRWQWPTLAGVAGVLIVVIIIAASNRNDGSGATPADNGKSLAAAGDEAKKPKPNGAAKPTKPSDKPTESTNDQVAPPVKPRLLGDLIPLDPPDPSTPTSPTEPPKAEPVEPSKPVEPPKEPTPAGKPSPPTEDERRAALVQFNEVFGKEWASAKTNEAKTTLAQKLIEQALQAGNAPAIRYVLFEKALDLYAAVGDLKVALATVDTLSQHFEVVALERKVVVLEDFSTAARPSAQIPVVLSQVGATALELLDAALAVDDFKSASELLRLAQKGPDKAAKTESRKKKDELDRIKREYGVVTTALEKLASDPKDAEANLVVGRWYCLVKNDWDKGLPYLAKSVGSAEAEIAKHEQAQPSDPKQCIGLGDAWAELVSKEPVHLKPSVAGRALFWYQQAMPKLSPIDQATVEKRTRPLKAFTATVASRIGVIEPGNVAAATNGAVIHDPKKLWTTPEKMIDGSRKFVLNEGIGTGKWPCECVIELPKVYLLSEIVLLLYLEQGGDRYYNYRLQVSRDGLAFTEVKNASEGQYRGLQDIAFPKPLPVRFIKLVALRNSANPGFHVAEIEAYCLPPQSAK